MTVMELIDMLKEANPEALVTLEYSGFLFDPDSVEVFNNRVYIQGY